VIPLIEQSRIAYFPIGNSFASVANVSAAFSYIPRFRPGEGILAGAQVDIAVFDQLKLGIFAMTA